MFRILLLVGLMSRVCGTFEVKVTQASYQAEENHDVTLEWTFTSSNRSRTHEVFILCQLRTDRKLHILFELNGGEEVQEFQHRQFAGRVQWDKDVLREGRLRLHVSRLRTEDSGLYECDVRTSEGEGSESCRLSVAAYEEEPEGPHTGNPIWVIVGVIIFILIAMAACCTLLKFSRYRGGVV